MCLQHLEGPTLYPWLEPFFVPYQTDFTIRNGNDQRHIQLVSKYFWVPVYHSNVKDRYEAPEDRGVFDKAELIRLRDENTFTFETAPETDSMPESRRLQSFLNSLTGWNLLTFFFATAKVLQHHRLASNQGSCNVLCFQKGREKRIAIRKVNGNDKSKTEWITAKLADPQVITKTETLEAQLSSVERGQFLTLASVTAAAEGPQKSSKKSEAWSFTIEHSAAKIYQFLTVSEPVASVLTRLLLRLQAVY